MERIKSTKKSIAKYLKNNKKLLNKFRHDISLYINHLSKDEMLEMIRMLIDKYVIETMIRTISEALSKKDSMVGIKYINEIFDTVSQHRLNDLIDYHKAYVERGNLINNTIDNDSKNNNDSNTSEFINSIFKSISNIINEEISNNYDIENKHKDEE